jgi:hypothetical protein
VVRAGGASGRTSPHSQGGGSASASTGRSMERLAGTACSILAIALAHDALHKCPFTRPSGKQPPRSQTPPHTIPHICRSVANPVGVAPLQRLLQPGSGCAFSHLSLAWHVPSLQAASVCVLTLSKDRAAALTYSPPPLSSSSSLHPDILAWKPPWAQLCLILATNRSCFTSRSLTHGMRSTSMR